MSLSIKASKKAQLFSLIFAVAICIIVFIIITLLITAEEKAANYYFYLTGFIVLFIYMLVLSVIGCINLAKSLFNKNAVLLINEDGIYHNLGVIYTGKMQWEDIAKVQVIQTKKFNIRYMLIQLVDNNEYLEGKNFIQKYFLKKTLKEKVHR